VILLKKNQRLANLPFSELTRLLSARLRQPLPGLATQLKMSSNTRYRELMNFRTPEHATPSSVLLLLYPAEGNVYTVFMQRPEYDGIHSGQISLPGGKAEKTDPGPAFTALREAREEIGIDPEKVTIIGRLTDLYIPPSNYVVSPFIGYLAARPVFTIEPAEVRKIVEIRLSDLVSDENIREERFRIRDDFELTAPAYVVGGEIIWGATAMIVAEFCEIMKELLAEINR
jgi:8-oxo-dGTP pyrophosphatase MutT (NUDIX family)